MSLLPFLYKKVKTLILDAGYQAHRYEQWIYGLDGERNGTEYHVLKRHARRP